jgi:hypothetical protein
MTSNEKVDRDALERLPRAADRRASMMPPGTDAERALATIWCDLLNVTEVSVEDNFFDVGGHSLLVVEMQHRIRSDFHRPIDLVDLFKHTSIRALARYLEDGTSEDAPTAAIQARARRRRTSSHETGSGRRTRRS